MSDIMQKALENIPNHPPPPRLHETSSLDSPILNSELFKSVVMSSTPPLMPSSDLPPSMMPNPQNPIRVFSKNLIPPSYTQLVSKQNKEEQRHASIAQPGAPGAPKPKPYVAKEEISEEKSKPREHSESTLAQMRETYLHMSEEDLQRELEMEKQRYCQTSVAYENLKQNYYHTVAMLKSYVKSLETIVQLSKHHSYRKIEQKLIEEQKQLEYKIYNERWRKYELKSQIWKSVAQWLEVSVNAHTDRESQSHPNANPNPNPSPERSPRSLSRGQYPKPRNLFGDSSRDNEERMSHSEQKTENEPNFQELPPRTDRRYRGFHRRQDDMGREDRRRKSRFQSPKLKTIREKRHGFKDYDMVEMMHLIEENKRLCRYVNQLRHSLNEERSRREYQSQIACRANPSLSKEIERICAEIQ